MLLQLREHVLKLTAVDSLELDENPRSCNNLRLWDEVNADLLLDEDFLSYSSSSFPSSSSSSSSSCSSAHSTLLFCGRACGVGLGVCVLSRSPCTTSLLASALNSSWAVMWKAYSGPLRSRSWSSLLAAFWGSLERRPRIISGTRSLM